MTSLKDSQFNSRGGVNSAEAPEALSPDTLAWAKNVVIRGGKPKTRPPLIERARLPKGRFQGIGYFSANGGSFIVQVGGVPYRLSPNGLGFSIDQIPTTFFNAPSIPRVWMQETDGSFIIQDNQSAPLIYDGSATRRALREKSEVPIGAQMAYGNGRLWVATMNGLVAGDVKTSDFQSELLFTETNYLLGGGAHYLPRKATGMAFMPVTDTATGLGPLLVFTEGNAESFRAEITSRDLWGSIPGFRTEALPDIGACSHHAIVRVNQDVYFRASDGGIRSFRSARAEIEKPGNTPISAEVGRLLDYESRALLADCSAIFFDNRLLVTASPFFGPRGQVVYRDIVSLDFAPLATNLKKLPPAYDGEWEGAQFVRLIRGKFNGEDRAFVVSCDSDGGTRLWEIATRGIQDRTLVAASPIKSCVEYRRFVFQEPNQLKRLKLCRVYVSDLGSNGTLEIQYRADGEAQWTKWDERAFSAFVTETPSGTGPKPLRNLHPQYRTGVGTFTIPDDESATSRRLRYVGYMFQIRLIWTGSLQIDRIELLADVLSESLHAEDVEPQAGVAMATEGNEVRYVIPLSPGSAVEPSIPVYASHAGAPYEDHEGNNYTPMSV